MLEFKRDSSLSFQTFAPQHSPEYPKDQAAIKFSQPIAQKEHVEEDVNDD
jgi:hypothetical protein